MMEINLNKNKFNLTESINHLHLPQNILFAFTGLSYKHNQHERKSYIK